MKTEKHCQRHGPLSHPYCVECWRDDHAKEKADDRLGATACSPSLTPETDAALCRYDHPAWPGGRKFTVNGEPVVLADLARKLERKMNAALDALDKIESHYVDGDDTYEAWKAMGEIAATFLAENS